ncbi:N-carbamoyl-L-amino acid hydrolase [Listeria monocytogenes N53-1]|nr:N-carbamoyl-L-amino acid hydrolase [Listeria monocytogenes]CCQ23004.1 N-carbamoyl-L-amino acid hydrolase [Listeria monocytogenes N53-1]
MQAQPQCLTEKMRLTVGKLNVYPNGANVIPDKVVLQKTKFTSKIH